MDDFEGFGLPEWATTHNFTHHSPSGVTRPDDLEFFEKSHLRPNKIWTSGGCPLTAGIAAHDYVTDILTKDMDAAEAYRAAVARLHEHKVQEHFEPDRIKYDAICDSIYEIPKSEPKISGTVFELTLQHLLQGTREATAGANRIVEGRWASAEFPALSLPFKGQLDLEDPGVVELKTKWPTLNSNVKRGWTAKKCPAHPDFNHVVQVAYYWHWLRQSSENVSVKLIYATCRDFKVFTNVEEPALSEANLSRALDHLKKVARKRELIMRAAPTKEDLFELVTPDFSHFMWQDKVSDPLVKDEITAVWGSK